MQKYLILTSLFVLCMGCNDIAERQRQAEEVRRQQTANDLRELGEAMHRESAADSTQTNAPESNSDSSPQNNGDSSE